MRRGGATRALGALACLALPLAATVVPVSTPVAQAVPPTYPYPQSALVALNGTTGDVSVVPTPGAQPTVVDHVAPSGVAVAVDPAQDLFYDDPAAHTLLERHPDGTVAVLAHNRHTTGLATDPAGDLFALDADHTITRYGADGTTRVVYQDDALEGTGGLAADAAGDVLFPLDVGTAGSPATEIDSIHADGTFYRVVAHGVLAAADGHSPTALSLDPGGAVYAAFGTWGLAKVAPDHGSAARLVPGDVVGVATDPRGRVYVADATAGVVDRYAADGTGATRVTSSVSDPRAIAVVGRLPQSVALTSTPPTAPQPHTTYSVSATPGSSTAANVVSVSGSCSYDAATGTVTFGHPGVCTVADDQGGDDTYLPAHAEQRVVVVPIPQVVTFTSAPPSGAAAVAGHTYAVTATGGNGGYGVGFRGSPFSTPANACFANGSTVYLDHAGVCLLEAVQPASTDGDYAEGTAQMSITVAKATSFVQLSTSPTGVEADIGITPPGYADRNGGSVQFAVDGQDLGSPVLVSGSGATLAVPVPAGRLRHVSATYSGNSDVLGSSASLNRDDPTITARVTSSAAANAAGWYHTPVTVSFTCTPAGSTARTALTTACPAPVTLGSDGAGQSVTRTVAAADGGVGSVSVSGLDIDRTGPTVELPGVVDGGASFAVAPPPECEVSDATSGATQCEVSRLGDGHRFSYRGEATDVAGNTTVVERSLSVLQEFVAGAPWNRGRFEVVPGARYVLRVATSGTRAPRLYLAGPRRPGRAGPLFKPAPAPAGRHYWTLTWRARGPSQTHVWALGVRVGTTMRSIPLRAR